jgi:hypothetical protein
MENVYEKENIVKLTSIYTLQAALAIDVNYQKRGQNMQKIALTAVVK